MRDAGAVVGHSQPAHKVPGAGVELWCQVLLPVNLNRQIKCRFVMQDAGAGLRSGVQ